MCLRTGQQGGICKDCHLKAWPEWRLKQLYPTKTEKLGLGRTCHSFHTIPDVTLGNSGRGNCSCPPQNIISALRVMKGRKFPSEDPINQTVPSLGAARQLLLCSAKKSLVRLVVTWNQPQIKNCSTQTVSNATPSQPCGETSSPCNSSPGFCSFLPFAGIIFKTALCSCWFCGVSATRQAGREAGISWEQGGIQLLLRVRRENWDNPGWAPGGDTSRERLIPNKPWDIPCAPRPLYPPKPCLGVGVSYRKAVGFENLLQKWEGF